MNDRDTAAKKRGVRSEYEHHSWESKCFLISKQWIIHLVTTESTHTQQKPYSSHRRAIFKADRLLRSVCAAFIIHKLMNSLGPFTFWLSPRVCVLNKVCVWLVGVSFFYICKGEKEDKKWGTQHTPIRNPKARTKKKKNNPSGNCLSRWCSGLSHKKDVQPSSHFLLSIIQAHVLYMHRPPV